MEREERKRKFTKAIVNILYPPPPQYQHEPQSPPSQSQPDQELKPVQASDAIPDTLEEYENASTSGDEEHESEPDQKQLTRAQRKKIRKKKLKQEAIHRGNLIGPLLPLNRTNTNQCADPDAKRSPPVRQNVSENIEENSGADEPAGALPAKKVNRRRKAKKMAKVKPKSSSNSDISNQHSVSNPSDDLKEAN